jgi:polyisoprenoid-binding protein YceI
MIDKARPATPAATVPRPARKRRWWPLVLGGVATLAVLIVAAVGLFIKLNPGQPPLELPTTPASAPSGPLDAVWRAGPGSVAGFRVQETALGFSNDVTGRTSAVSGTLTVSGGRVTYAAFRVDLAAIKVNGKTQPQFASSLGTRAYPTATFTLGGPVVLPAAFGAGATVRVTAAGELTMHGVTHPATAAVAARRDGTALELAGSIPVQFAAWGIKEPGGFGFLASLADHGVAEFSVTLYS